MSNTPNTPSKPGAPAQTPPGQAGAAVQLKGGAAVLAPVSAFPNGADEGSERESVKG